MKGGRIKFAGNKRKRHKAIRVGSLVLLLLAGIAARAEPLSAEL